MVGFNQVHADSIEPLLELGFVSCFGTIFVALKLFSKVWKRKLTSVTLESACSYMSNKHRFTDDHMRVRLAWTSKGRTATLIFSYIEKIKLH